MPAKFLPPRTTTAVRMAATPISGEIIFDVDTKALYLGDGVTPGGVIISKSDEINEILAQVLDQITTEVGADGEVLTIDSSSETGFSWSDPLLKDLRNTKGELIVSVNDTQDTRLPPNGEGSLLITKSDEPAGVKWYNTPPNAGSILISDNNTVDKLNWFPKGLDGNVLLADSNEPTGLRWGVPSSIFIYEFEDIEILRTIDLVNDPSLPPTTCILVREVGLFTWYENSTELDDGETCLNTENGAWQLDLVSWETVNAYIDNYYSTPVNNRLSDLEFNLENITYKEFTFSFVLNSLAPNTHWTHVITDNILDTDILVVQPPVKLPNNTIIQSHVTNGEAYVHIINNQSSTQTYDNTNGQGEWKIIVFNKLI